MLYYYIVIEQNEWDITTSSITFSENQYEKYIVILKDLPLNPSKYKFTVLINEPSIVKDSTILEFEKEIVAGQTYTFPIFKKLINYDPNIRTSLRSQVSEFCRKSIILIQKIFQVHILSYSGETEFFKKTGFYEWLRFRRASLAHKAQLCEPWVKKPDFFKKTGFLRHFYGNN